MQSNKLEIPEIPATITLVKSPRAKRLSMTIKPFKPIRVTIPRHVSYKVARQFVESNVDWLKKAHERVQKAQQLQEDNRVKSPPLDMPLAKKQLIGRLQYFSQKNFCFKFWTLQRPKFIFSPQKRFFDIHWYTKKHFPSNRNI